MIFAVTLERGGQWDRSRRLREQQGFPEPTDYMDAFVERGLVRPWTVLRDGLGATRHTSGHG